jgi:hypothetical protein
MNKESYPEFPDRIWLHGDGRKLTSSQTEISDEEILDAAARCKLYADVDVAVGSFELGARWYREQLKNKL